MNTDFQRLSEAASAFIAGLYTWMVTIFFGLVLLDISYARRLPHESAAFAGVADLLLLAGFVTLLAGLGAAVLSWRSRSALLLYLASVLALSLEFLLPAVLPLLLQNAGGLAWLRPLPGGLASILAFLGLYRMLARRPALLAQAGTGD